MGVRALRNVRGVIMMGMLIAIVVSAGLDMYVYAQTNNLDHYDLGVLKEKVTDHVASSDRRMENLEVEGKATERRLTILETLAESNTYLLRGIAVAIALLALKEMLVWRTEMRRSTDRPQTGTS